MLTISQVAARYGLSNRQVYDLINLGFLNIARVTRENKGITYWLAEQDLERLDIYSLVAQARDRNHHSTSYKPPDWKRLNRTMAYCQRFLEDISASSYRELLESCFYLFHLNHYAKRYTEESKNLYSLKKQVLRKMMAQYGEFFEVTYLVGPDRQKVWLCEDCKGNARKVNMPYAEYARSEYYCSKCYVQTLEKEYYSLIQFDLALEQYRFSFHLPLASAHWIKDRPDINHGTRKSGSYNDCMYLYGRPVSRIEEQVYPLTAIVDGLTGFLNSSPPDFNR